MLFGDREICYSGSFSVCNTWKPVWRLVYVFEFVSFIVQKVQLGNKSGYEQIFICIFSFATLYKTTFVIRGLSDTFGSYYESVKLPNGKHAELPFIPDIIYKNLVVLN